MAARKNAVSGGKVQSKEVKRREGMPWLRPSVGLFAILAGLLYLGVALIFATLSLTANYQANMSQEQHREYYEILSKENGISAEDADKILASRREIGKALGSMFPIQMALASCLSLLIVTAGVGLFLRKSWSISLGRLACISIIIVICAILALNKEGISLIGEKINEIEPQENFQRFGWLTALRYGFLFSLCPAALLIGFGAVVKQYSKASKN